MACAVSYVAQRGSCPFCWALPSTLLRQTLLPWFVCWRLPGFCVALRKIHGHEKNKVNGGEGCSGYQWSLISALWMQGLTSFMAAVKLQRPHKFSTWWHHQFSIWGAVAHGSGGPALLVCICLLQISLSFPLSPLLFLSLLPSHSIRGVNRINKIKPYFQPYRLCESLTGCSHFCVIALKSLASFQSLNASRELPPFMGECGRSQTDMNRADRSGAEGHQGRTSRVPSYTQNKENKDLA